jgi:hypothetical protein
MPLRSSAIIVVTFFRLPLAELNAPGAVWLRGTATEAIGAAVTTSTARSLLTGR